MNITVFGASGATGHALVQMALAQQYQVTAFVRKQSGLAIQHPRLNVIEGNLDQATAVLEAVRDADVVVSVLGVRKAGNANVCADGVQSILAALTAKSLLPPQLRQKHRLIVLSAFGAGETRDTSVSAWLIRKILAGKMRDKDQMEASVKAADVDWTIVRPPALTNGLPTGKYQSGVGLSIGFFARISRANVAHFILREALECKYIQQSPTIAE